MSPNPLYPLIQTQIFISNLRTPPHSPRCYPSPCNALVKGTTPLPGIYEIVSPTERILRYIEGNTKKKMCGFVMWEDLFVRVESGNSTMTEKKNQSGNSSIASTASTTPLLGGKSTGLGEGEDEWTPDTSSSPSHIKLLAGEFPFNTPISPSLSDMEGYHKLRRPQRVTYNSVLKRWMFNKELSSRTSTYTIYSKPLSSRCPLLRHLFSYSGKEKQKRKAKRREFFVLDDGKSWIMTGYLDGKKVGYEKTGVFQKVEGKGMVMLDKKQEEELDLKLLSRDGVCIYRDEDDEDYYVDVWRYFQIGRSSTVEFLRVDR